MLCTLAKTPCAIVPVDGFVATIDATMVSNVGPRNDGHIIEFDSPTGQYQRGPPIGAAIFG